ncbi:hypothetical protein PAXRUDRAFT_178973 [Paxillus rubicundulus Ve08.2h10]|uniref:Unplaced genomic scaffold scaffold_5155, whole genome shotgun sequence n=1 Tax=Paxillus rubicundulus Ve08.2h10 TaxID=930991 RepID=A0A0D0BNU9_9AGAM|nr:hypothetical protein PAXRUDRAFT_178973 [Paxillus rubicundulus Ve08.2h10]
MWKKKGEGLTSREVKGTVKFGGSLMVWGCIGWNGYVAILEGGLLESMDDSGIPADEVIFQQDSQAYLQKSPDLV